MLVLFLEAKNLDKNILNSNIIKIEKSAKSQNNISKALHQYLRSLQENAVDVKDHLLLDLGDAAHQIFKKNRKKKRKSGKVDKKNEPNVSISYNAIALPQTSEIKRENDEPLKRDTRDIYAPKVRQIANSMLIDSQSRKMQVSIEDDQKR